MGWDSFAPVCHCHQPTTKKFVRVKKNEAVEKMSTIVQVDPLDFIYQFY